MTGQITGVAVALKKKKKKRVEPLMWSGDSLSHPILSCSFLMSILHTALKREAIWMRRLLICLLGIEITVAQGLMNRLEKEGFIRPALKGKR